MPVIVVVALQDFKKKKTQNVEHDEHAYVAAINIIL